MQLELRQKSKAMMKACMFTIQICKGWRVGTRTQLNFLQALRNEILTFKKCSLDEGAVSALFVLVNRITLTFIVCLYTGCELQQESKPYEFKHDDQAEQPTIQATPKQFPEAETKNARPSPPLLAGRQDSSKTFDSVAAQVVKGTPKNEFPDLNFPE